MSFSPNRGEDLQFCAIDHDGLAGRESDDRRSRNEFCVFDLDFCDFFCGGSPDFESRVGKKYFGAESKVQSA